VDRILYVGLFRLL